MKTNRRPDERNPLLITPVNVTSDASSIFSHGPLEIGTWHTVHSSGPGSRGQVLWPLMAMGRIVFPKYFGNLPVITGHEDPQVRLWEECTRNNAPFFCYHPKIRIGPLVFSSKQEHLPPSMPSSLWLRAAWFWYASPCICDWSCLWRVPVFSFDFILVHSSFLHSYSFCGVVSPTNVDCFERSHSWN